MNIQSLTAPRLCVYNARVTPYGFNSNWHSHAFYELGIVLQGTCHWHCGGKKSHPVREGQAILLPPQSAHRESGDKPVRLGWIGFDWKSAWPGKSLRRPVTLGAATGDISYLMQRIYEEQHSQRPGSVEICALALRQVIVLFQRAASERQPPSSAHALSFRQVQVAQSLAAYLDQNVGHPHSLEQVAEYHRLSPAHLSLLFQKHYKITPTAYRQQKRVERAQELLGEGMASIKEIAAACGFTDAAHFCKEFKKRTGCTPGEYRQGNADA